MCLGFFTKKMPRVRLTVGSIGNQVFNYRWIGQCAGVAKVVQFVSGDLAEYPAHDFTRSGFWQARRPLNNIWFGDSADLCSALVH